jgi:hypothetical protein
MYRLQSWTPAPDYAPRAESERRERAAPDRRPKRRFVLAITSFLLNLVSTPLLPGETDSKSRQA